MSTATAPPPIRSSIRVPSERVPRMFGTDLSAPWPGRGLAYSVLAHGLFLIATLMVPWNYWMPGVRLVIIPSQVREQQLYLPNLEPMAAAGGSGAAPGSAHREPKTHPTPEPAGKSAASAPAEAVQGVVHPGPQIILSNPPHPDNFKQTILQPDLPRAPKLPHPLPIPPMVSVAPARPELVAPAPQREPPPEQPPAKPVAMLPAPQNLPTVEAPKLPLPASSAQETPLNETSVNKVASAPVPAALPKLARPQVALADEATGTHNVLVVDAIPVPNAKSAEVPPGELHGAFTVAPSGTYSPSPAAAAVAGGGTAPEGAPGAGAANGTASGTSAGRGTAAGLGTGEGTAAASGAGTGTGTANGTGTGLAAGTGLGSGTGSARGTGTGHAAGKGSGAGTGTGAGSGVGTGAGTGAGTANAGAGTSPFPGITIQGGSSSGGRTRTAVPINPKPQTSYGFTIVAHGASGGGFRDYGIFTDHASYTVYLDMADAGMASNWALQYAPDTSRAPNSSDPPVPTLGTLEPPYALTKALPLLTPEIARRSRGGTVVVYGVINRNGDWEKTRIMSTPDPNLNRYVVEAMAKWVFEPAKMYGRPVPVKCLLGIPVNSLPIQ